MNDELDSVAPQVERLKLASASLQKALPSAEAKVTLQDRFMALLEGYERSGFSCVGVCSVGRFSVAALHMYAHIRHTS